LKKIGGGLEFNVFLLNKTTVLKRPTSKRQKQLILRRFYPNKSSREIQKIILHAEKSLDYSQRNMRKHVLKRAPWILGNPVLLGNLKYTQDKVTVLGKYIQSHSFNENKKVLQSYVSCIMYQWKLGFFHKIFNFTINYGIDKKCSVILLDLGELTFSKYEVARLIKKKDWLTSWSYTSCRDIQLKRYYAELLDEKINLEVLNRLWRSGI
jgi:hypothetical protein